MQVKRVFGDKNKTVLCNVPPMLPGDLFNEPVDIKAMQGIELHFGDFSISSFMARYLAGNRSLKEARKVSRKRLALVASSVGYLDPEAYELQAQIQRYIKAKRKFIETEHHTLKSVLALNRIIVSESEMSGAVRHTQNWVGGKTVFVARYVCPPPELVPELVENWLGFINEKDYSPETKAIIGHCRLASIHPFNEGNGRTARLLMDGLLEKAYGDRVPLLIYRLSPSCPPNAHIEAQELLNVGDPKGYSHSFWFDALSWADKLQVKIVEILSEARKIIYGKIGLGMLSASSAKLLDYLWCQPVVCQQGLLTLFDMDLSKVRVAINELIGFGILETRKLREPENAVIYDCPIIFTAYAAMDDAISTVADNEYD
jgi:hypothetical protein